MVKIIELTDILSIGALKPQLGQSLERTLAFFSEEHSLSLICLLTYTLQSRAALLISYSHF